VPTLPWKTTPAAAAHLDDTVVMASRLELASIRDVPRFFRTALAIRRQVLAAPGALAVSLIAQPFARTFWTLSAWQDQPSLNTFVGAQPHKGGMTSFRPKMQSSTFVTWHVPTSAFPVTWADAKNRIADRESAGK
jgi:Domain of unknown function (DUF3291)